MHACGIPVCLDSFGMVSGACSFPMFAGTFLLSYSSDKLVNINGILFACL